MAGISDLSVLLASMEPRLDPRRFAFAVVPHGAPLPVDLLSPEMAGMIREDEGLTLVLTAEAARRHGLAVWFEAERITLSVHSDLAAVGLTAAFARALAEAGISANVLAGARHDHIFVHAGSGAAALAALGRLQQGAG